MYSHTIDVDTTNNRVKMSFNLSQYFTSLDTITTRIISTGIYLNDPSNLNQFVPAFFGQSKYTIEITGPSISTPIVKTMDSDYFMSTNYDPMTSLFYLYLEFVDSSSNYLLPQITFQGATSTPTLFNIYVDSVCYITDVENCPLTCDTEMLFFTNPLLEYNPGSLPPSLSTPSGINNTGIGFDLGNLTINCATLIKNCITVKIPSSMNVPDMAYDAVGLCFYYPFAFKSTIGYPANAVFNGFHVKFSGDIVSKISNEIKIWSPGNQSTKHIVKFTSYNNSSYPPVALNSYIYWATHVNSYFDGIDTNILLTIQNLPSIIITSNIIDPNYILVELFIKLTGTIDTSVNFPKEFENISGLSNYYILTDPMSSDIGSATTVPDSVFFSNPPNTVFYYPVTILSIAGNCQTHAYKGPSPGFGEIRTDQSCIIKKQPIVHPIATCFHPSTSFYLVERNIKQSIRELKRNDKLRLENGKLVNVIKTVNIPWGKKCKFAYFKAGCFGDNIPLHDLKVTKYHYIKHKNIVKFAHQWISYLNSPNAIIIEEEVDYLYHILVDTNERIEFINYGGLFVDVWGRKNKCLYNYF